MLMGDSSYGWRDLGLDVSIVVHDHGQPRVTTVEGIRAVATYRKRDDHSIGAVREL